MSYLLNGTDITNPKSLTRTPLHISSDVECLDGTTKRDVSGAKERFVLSWEIMTKAEFDALLAIVELNTAVSFSVDEGNLSIAETQVVTRIGSVEYSTPGSLYLANVSLELIEVA